MTGTYPPPHETTSWRCPNAACCTRITITSIPLDALQCPVCGDLDMVRYWPQPDPDPARDSGEGSE